MSDEDPSASEMKPPSAADMKPTDTATGEASSPLVKPTASTIAAAKGGLKNIKTMFYVGTEVSLLILCGIILT